jgi:DNA invertase Pin-like site-specific DNA recombinase
MIRKCVTYLRVSTDRQGRSGLGLEGQKAAVEAYCALTDTTISREYVEIESGRNNERPKLTEALAFARRAKAALLVAKLDRLSRNVRFIATVMDSGVEFAAADMPDANRLTLHVLAAVAENEARAISDRTKAALQAAKARGIKLGSANPRVPPLTRNARMRGAAAGTHAVRRKAVEAYSDLLPYMTTLHKTGNSLRTIARRLNNDGHKTRSDAAWTAVQVMRVLRRAEPSP